MRGCLDESGVESQIEYLLLVKYMYSTPTGIRNGSVKLILSIYKKSRQYRSINNTFKFW